MPAPTRGGKHQQNAAVQLSLAECLEVRAGPLEEDELWALICEGAVAIQDLFLNGRVKKILLKLLLGVFCQNLIQIDKSFV